MNSAGKQKNLILFLIIITAIVPALFIELDEATSTLNIYKLIAKTGSLIGTSLFAWQFLIGFRQAVPYLIEDFIWSIELHKKLGMFASIFILLHPVFITLFYLEKEGTNPLTLTLKTPFDAYVMLGQVSLVIIAVIFFTSAVFRRYMSFDAWYATHLLVFLLLPIVFVHSFPIGTTLLNTSARYIWIGIASVLAIFYVYRVMCRLGFLSVRHTVVDALKVAPDTTEIRNSPWGHPINPKLSQFVYFRRGFVNIARPYTVSDYDEASGLLSVTAKASGRTSTALQRIAPGKNTYIDGPYGVFAVNIFDLKRPVVMVAGGIGITPFRRICKKIEHDVVEHPFYLFYANRHEDEIAYRDELDQIDNLKTVHVISDQPDFKGEKGLVTTQLIKKYVNDDLSAHTFFICGPPVMTKKLEEQLQQEDVSPGHIHHELFDY